MKTFYFSLLSIFLMTIPGFLHAQGCSDAGFCTVNSLKPHNSADSSNVYKNELKAGFSLGNADNSVTVYGQYLEYNRQISSTFGISAKATSIAQTGNGISVFGLSDVYLNSNYRLDKNITFTLGAKIPLNNGNKADNGSILPMDYQSSLGTFDLIAGIGYQIKKLQLVAALQQPLTQNENQFNAKNYPASSPLAGFQSTKDFKRTGDVLLRASYPVKITEKLLLTPGLLNIYHLSKDKFTNSAGVEEEIDGSEGLTINGNIFLDYNLNKTNALQLNVGVPFLVRDTRPDGLTRSFIANLEYRFRF
ncbi:hypothetical protein [Chryseobacterium profundimaris]|uniref:Transporter n=1 Tax=Chryseobacterium profundimaris TaxID=1387275 RepID=A0ABY1P5Q2_9FLAO|nr:hypothetical protein [Chryseobacterium profundimaris]SMP26949.1 hypothetical protein SAMN06264346_10992 [Chryseobacterium profundimaris]